jgi:type IV pilus assembly protein PilY1
VSENALKALNNNVVPATIPLTPNGSQGNWADEWARYMANSDCNFTFSGVQNVYTYAIDVGPADTLGGQGPGWTALMKSMSVGFGKGKYFPVANNAPDTGSQIEAALAAIFQEVQAVNSVFASTTLPVSVNVRGTNLNQVYIGVFRPDQTKNPRWFGNLKLYKLGVNTATSTLFLADAVGGAAENASTGFISGNAQSFWTSSSSFWSYRDPTQNGVGGNSDMPDGDLVEKGGAAQRIRVAFPTSQTTRNVYTCTSGTGLCAPGDLLSASLFNTANTDITAADMSAYTTYPVTSLSSSARPPPRSSQPRLRVPVRSPTATS